MFKRVRWMGTGVALGLGGSIWIQKKLRTAADRYKPAAAANAAANRAKDALLEGRSAMREREAELRGASGKRRARRP
ncbi:MAG TPA: hypothetical protein VG435_13450 [Acidimicrobiales bacterium]|jgi:hypothetical protein|nr:hypothetical protein [Acidimicrobiales bacterium]